MHIEILSNLVITNVYSASTLYTRKHTKVKRSCREQWAIVNKYEGETLYLSKTKTLTSNSQKIIFLPKGCSYEWECTKSGHYSIIEFECEQTYPEPFSFPINHSENLLKQFKNLEHVRNLHEPMFELESIRDTYSIILSITALNCSRYVPQNKHQKIQPALEYISLHYDQNITNDMLATVTGISTVYFRKLFKEITGISPITYVKQFRITKAKEMLKSDYGTLTEIAHALGYSSLYDFSRDFKNQVGIAPSKYNNFT